MFKILWQTSPLTRHSRQNSLGSDATTVSSSDSESASAFEEFILHNQNTWLNNVEELCFDYLRNKDKQRQVVLDRQSITYQQSSYLLKMVPKNLKDIEGLFHFKLETVFQDLANKYTTTEPKPRSDITEGFNFRPHGHPHDNLASKGFSKEELTSMSLADAIVYDAVIFSARSWAGHLSDCQPYLVDTEMAETYQPLFQKVCETIEQKIIEKIRQYREVQLACTTPNSDDSARSSLTSLEALSEDEQELEQTDSPQSQEIKLLKQKLEKAEAEQKLAIEQIQSQHAIATAQLQTAHDQDITKMAAEHQKNISQVMLTHKSEIQQLSTNQANKVTKLKSNIENLTVLRQRDLQAKKQAEAQLEATKKANDKLQTFVALQSINSDLPIQAITPNNQPAIQCPNSLFSGISYEVLGGFITVIGICAVALAFAALSVASLGVLPAAGIMAAGTLLAAGGFFCIDKGATQRVIETQYYQEHYP